MLGSRLQAARTRRGSVRERLASTRIVNTACPRSATDEARRSWQARQRGEWWVGIVGTGVVNVRVLVQPRVGRDVQTKRSRGAR